MIENIKKDFEKHISSKKFSKKVLDEKKNSLDLFSNEGLPNRKTEEWKFSDIERVLNSNIQKLNFFNQFNENEKIDTSELIGNFEHNKIVFFNGFIKNTDFGFEDENKIEVIRNDEDIDIFSNKTNSLLNLNYAFLSEYIKIKVKKNYQFKKPLVVYNFSSDIETKQNINNRLDIVLEENSHLKVINFDFHKSINNFINLVNSFKIDKNSILKFFNIDPKKNNNIKYNFTDVDLEENSIFESFIFSSGSNFSKQDINCKLHSKYSSAFINGILKLSESKHHEIKTNINHLSENTKSYQLIKSVLEDNSKGVYQGKIYVDQIAQKTDGYQLSKALLLNKDVEFDAKPELEIYADDVKCSHGSTSGNLDENSIFYLMSRGLSQKQSKQLLIEGFILDVIEKITDPEIKNLIKKLTGIDNESQ